MYNYGAMCGAYGFTKKEDADELKDLIKSLGLKNTIEDFKPRYNIRPTQKAPIIINTADGASMEYGYWSFIPTWSKTRRLKFSTFNARDDRLLESKLYRPAVPGRRCLILADLFYEPDKINFLKPPHPWHLFRQKDQSIMTFAGLYNEWTDPETKEKLLTYTIVTTEPNSLVGTFHNREPAMLDETVRNEWLNPDIVEPEQVVSLLQPYPADNMEQWHVDDAAKNPRNDYPELVKPVE